ISATVAGLTPVTFNLTVQEAPEATTLVLVSGDGQTIEPGALSSALTVRVDDQDTNPFEGAEVTFAIESGDGTLTSTSETTAANGQASTTVTAGATEGALTISATVAGLTPVTFNLTVQVASFFTDFEEYATGAFPSDWTDRGLQAQATSITVEQNVEGNFLEVDIGTTTPEHRGLSWADPGTAQDVRIRASFVPGSGAVPAFVMARGAADDTYYRLQIRNNDLLEIAKLVNNTLTLPIGGTGSGGDATFAYLDTDVVHLEFEVEGNQLRGRAWKNNDTAPAGWTVEITDSEISAAGWVGLGRIHAGTMQVLEFEVTPLD
ncbi:MAG: invasin domain 3-containing protein, partial [Gemmatimonadota bacterium]